MNLQIKLNDACWAARNLFERNRVSGSTANLSFLHEEQIYITASGTCFGRLTPEDFAVTDFSGNRKGDRKPSKEWALHRAVYAAKPQAQAVIHTHGSYMTLWSCLPANGADDSIPAYTPYLRLRVGRVGRIPYAPPGSEELFSLFGARVDASDAYLLQNHGGITAGESVLDAFYAIEELEESARIAWQLRCEPEAKMILPAEIDQMYMGRK